MSIVQKNRNKQWLMNKIKEKQEEWERNKNKKWREKNSLWGVSTVTGRQRGQQSRSMMINPSKPAVVLQWVMDNPRKPALYFVWCVGVWNHTHSASISMCASSRLETIWDLLDTASICSESQSDDSSSIWLLNHPFFGDVWIKMTHQPCSLWCPVLRSTCASLWGPLGSLVVTAQVQVWATPPMQWVQAQG